MRVFLLSFASLCVWLASPLPAAADELVRSITVQGEGEIQATPDEASLHFTLQNESRNLNMAKEANNKAVQKILAIIKPFGIADKDIQTSRLQLYPQYDYTDGSRRFRTYQISRGLSITIRKLGDAERITDALIQGGVEQVEQLQYGFADTQALQQQALMKATANAKAKAQKLATSLQTELGQVISIQEGGVSAPPMTFAAPMMMRAKADMAMESAPAPMPGEQAVTATVSVTFALK